LYFDNVNYSSFVATVRFSDPEGLNGCKRLAVLAR